MCACAAPQCFVSDQSKVTYSVTELKRNKSLVCATNRDVKQRAPLLFSKPLYLYPAPSTFAKVPAGTAAQLAAIANAQREVDVGEFWPKLCFLYVDSVDLSTCVLHSMSTVAYFNHEFTLIIGMRSRSAASRRRLQLPPPPPSPL